MEDFEILSEREQGAGRPGGAEAIPPRFDASLARLRFSDADAEIPKLIRR